MSQATRFYTYLDNILRDATIMPTRAPTATYDADTILTLHVPARVRWDTGSPGPNDVTLRFDLPESRKADVLVVPCWNVDGGSPAVARLTSGAGMDVEIVAPVLPEHRIPHTTAVDLTLLETNATLRTSNRFDLIIEDNAEPVVYGGAVALYSSTSVRAFPDRDLHWGYRQRHRAASVRQTNEYLTPFVQSLLTQERAIDVRTRASEADRAALYEWFAVNFGDTRPCFLWIDPEGRNLPFFGFPSAVFDQTDELEDWIDLSFSFVEYAKGKPL